jgi:hypothetical protein
MRKKLVLFSLVAALTIVVLLLSPIVSAQYKTQKTLAIKIGASGKHQINQDTILGGISIEITGTPEATGTVSTATYTANPQPDASKPHNVVLEHFIAVTFNMNPADFQNATIKIYFSDADVAGMTKPYTIYKYNPETNAFNPLNSEVDYTAKTITVTLTSTSDPLLAIGGLAANPSATPKVSPAEIETTISLSTWAWIFVSVEIITGIIVIIGIHQRTNRH